MVYESLRPEQQHGAEETHSWTYGHNPKVLASIPVVGSGTVDVYARADRWNPSHILASWVDDEWHTHWTWVPKGNTRQVTDSEWDIEEYHRCPEHLRDIQWGARLPGFLPG